MADTYLKQVEALEYFDPEPVLIRLREIELEVAASDLPEQVKALRTPGLKSAREGREAALFAHGLASVLGCKVLVAPCELADFDFVVAWASEEGRRYCPVQLKELVSGDRNPGTGIAELLAKVATRPTTDTILLIRLNRKESINVGELDLQGFPFRELWFLWQANPDGSHWSILGDALSTPYRQDFAYPSLGSED